MVNCRALAFYATLSLSIACASPGIPPGGPVDTEAPKLIRITPDSGSTGISPKEVLFRFDEVVSERPAGAPSLEGLFLISPRDGSPSVGWHRGEVSVKPRRGWRPNTPYTITMLPGMSDLRGNARNTGAITVFSTGPTIPPSHVSGTIFNWVTGSVAPRAFVEARAMSDTTTVYVAVADSTGRFVFPNLPVGSYRLRAILDDNSNRGLDPREAWDSATVTLTDSLRADLFAFSHDSIAPRLIGVGIRDSVTLDPNQSLTTASVGIKASDSSVVPFVSVSRPGTRSETTAAPAVYASTRPPPPTSIIVILRTALRAATTLRVRAIAIRSLDGISATTERVETLDPNPPQKAPPPPPPPAAAPAIRR